MAQLAESPHISTVQQANLDTSDHYPAQASGISAQVASDALRGEPNAPLPRSGLQTQMQLRVIVAGASNLGKTRFIDDLTQTLEIKRSSTGYGEDLTMKNSSKTFGSHRAVSLGGSASLSTTLDLYPDELTVHMGPLELPGLPDRVLSISMLDAPAYDVEPSQALYLAKLLEYILWQRVMDYRAMTFRTDSGPQRSSSILLCLYFLPPRKEVSPADLVFMSALSQVVPLAPVISLGPPPAVGMEASPGEERLADIQRAVMAAMQGYVRDGKPAPIKSLEAPSMMPMDGVAPGPRSDVEMFVGLMQTSLDDLICSDEKRLKHFRQLYDACGNDMMCLLWEIFVPYIKELHDAVSTTAAAPTFTNDETVVSEQINQGSKHASTAPGKHPAMPPTPEPLLAVKPRERDVSNNTEAAAQDVMPSAAPASVASSLHAVPSGAMAVAKAMTASVQPEKAVAAQDDVDAKAVMAESELERVVSAIEQIVEKLTMSLSAEQVAAQPHKAGTALDQKVEIVKREPCGSTMVIQEAEEPLQAPDTCDRGRAVFVQDVVRRVFTAVAADVTAREDAAIVQDTVRRAIAVVVANVSAREEAEVMQNTVRGAFTGATTKAEASSDVAVASGTNNVDIKWQMTQLHLRRAAADRGRALAVSTFVRRGMAAFYDGLAKSRSVAMAACAVVAKRSVSGQRSTSAPDAQEDVAAIVQGVVQRAMTAAVAAADAVPTTNAVSAEVEVEQLKDDVIANDDDVIAALVRRVMARAVESAERDSRRKDILQYVRSFLVSRPFYSTRSGSGASACVRMNGREAALLRSEPMNISMGMGLGIGVASLAGTLVVLVLRHKHSST